MIKQNVRLNEWIGQVKSGYIEAKEAREQFEYALFGKPKYPVLTKLEIEERNDPVYWRKREERRRALDRLLKNKIKKKYSF